MAYYESSGNLALYHHGIKGQKWGVRRYQNEDGSRTTAGKKRYASSSGLTAKQEKKLNKYKEKQTEYIKKLDSKETEAYKKAINKANKKGNKELAEAYKAGLENGKYYTNLHLDSIKNMTYTQMMAENKYANSQAGLRVVSNLLGVRRSANLDRTRYRTKIIDGKLIAEQEAAELKAYYENNPSARDEIDWDGLEW